MILNSWSFGVLLFEIFTMGDTPYPTIQPSDMLTYLESGLRLGRPKSSLCSDEMCVYGCICLSKCGSCRFDMMKSCWRVDANARPQVSDIRVTLSAVLERMAGNNGYYMKVIDDDSAITDCNGKDTKL